MVVRRNVFPAIVLAALGLTGAFAQLRIIQTNSGSENIHLIDPATNTIVGEVKDVPVNHGAAAARDGSGCTDFRKLLANYAETHSDHLVSLL